MLGYVIDAALVVLLLAALGGGFSLHRTLRRLQTSGNEFDQLIAALDAASGRAEAALADLKRIADDAGGRLAEEASGLQSLQDELAFMAQRAEQTAERLEKAISDARSVKLEPLPEVRPGKTPEPPPPMSQNDLEQALKSLR
jgi:chromosome segregation ATPase